MFSNRGFRSEPVADDPLASILAPPKSEPIDREASIAPEVESSHPGASGGSNAAAQGPGEFTRMFRPMEIERPAEPERPAIPERAAEAPKAVHQPPSDFTRIFVQIPAPPPDAKSSPHAQPITGPISPTNSGPNIEEKRVESQPSSSPSISGNNPASGQGELGEFTRMMRSVGSVPGDRAGSQPLANFASPGPELRGFSTPGQSNSASGDGGLTQIFQRISASPATPAPPADIVGDRSEQGFTDIFRTDRSSTPVPPRTEEREPAWPSSRVDSPPQEEKFSTTRMIEILSDPSQRAKSDTFDFFEESAPGRAQTPVASGATNYGFDAAPAGDNRSSSAAPPAQDFPSAAATPTSGDFTRIINSGMLRQSIPEPSAPPVAQPTPPPPPQVAMPAWPPAPAPTPVYTQPPVNMPQPAAPQISRPVAPALPASAPPPPVAVAAPQTKFQQYLPFLLILNVFVMVVLILLVIFLLRSR